MGNCALRVELKRAILAVAVFASIAIFRVFAIADAAAETLNLIVDEAGNIDSGTTHTWSDGHQTNPISSPHNLLPPTGDYILIAQVTDNGKSEDCVSSPYNSPSYLCGGSGGNLTIYFSDWANCTVKKAACQFTVKDASGTVATAPTNLQSLSVSGIVFLHDVNDVDATSYPFVTTCPPGRWLMNGQGQLVCI
jgi:hypothetical protein